MVEDFDHVRMAMAVYDLQFRAGLLFLLEGAFELRLQFVEVYMQRSVEKNDLLTEEPFLCEMPQLFLKDAAAYENYAPFFRHF
jgi:hypothetical protein